MAQQVSHYVINKMTAGITLHTASGVNGTFGQFIMKKDVFVPMHSHEKNGGWIGLANYWHQIT
jgi:hypothetical protein